VHIIKIKSIENHRFFIVLLNELIIPNENGKLFARDILHRDEE